MTCIKVLPKLACTNGFARCIVFFALHFSWGLILPIGDAMSRKKIDARQFVPEITAYAMAALMQFLPEFGVTPQRVCEGLNFTPEDLQRGMEMSHRQAWRLIRRALRLTGRPDLGLESGRRQNLSHFGLIGFAMMMEPDLHHAFKIAMRYYRQGGSLVEWDFRLEGAYGICSLTSSIMDASVQPFLIEEMASSALTLLRILLGPKFSFHAVDIAYDAPAHAERYREVFACPVRFGCAENRLLIEHHWFDVHLASYSPIIAAQLKELLEQRERSSNPALGTVAAIEHLLNHSGNAAMTIGEAAIALDLNRRTLTRRLADAGTSFRVLSDRVCAKVARNLLSEQGLTVTAAAEQLGFSDARSFRRAFKRWFGEAPGTVKRLD
jgi:AraC-like DNA-binding protein